MEKKTNSASVQNQGTKKRKKRFNNKKKNKNAATIEPNKNIPFVPVINTNIYCPKVVEPFPLCVICGKKIDTIADAISEGNGEYSHFACVIDKIGKQENINDKQKVSYLGKGSFGIIEKLEGKFTILKKIDYETQESFAAMKHFVEEQKK
ncbi:MAG: hypothetical protein WC162_11740 [Sphaerochaetaceae bacterium]